MNRTALAGLAVLAGSVTAPACLSVAGAQTPPKNCGGQHAAPQPASAAAPYRCILPPKTLHGTTFAGLVTANGTDVRVTIQIIGATRNVPTPALIEHHEGVSGASGPSDLRRGTIPAGERQITLIDSSPCREGQLDVFVVDVETKGDANRLGGPWIRNGTDCMGTQVTAPPPPITPSVPPAAVTPAPPVSTVGGTLPATGFGDVVGFTIIALFVIVIGAGGIAVRRRGES